ncbi:MAG: pyridoxal phosphate-dependent aminotransferase [Candidatus Binatia bacterium]
METVPFSGIRKMMERAQQLDREGKKVIHLEIGRPDFDTPVHIKQAATRALDEGVVHYTSNYGLPSLRSAIAEKLHRDNGLDYDPLSEIIVTAGANEGIFMALMATLNPGDEVLVPDPSWLNYFHCISMAGGRAVSVPLHEEDSFKLDPEEVARAITPRTRMLIVVSPHNPTGAVLSKDDLKALASLACERNLLVLADEIYEKLVYDGAEHHSIASLPGMWERTLTVNGFSKAYSMTGWRLGYVAGPRELIDILIRVHQYTAVCATSFAQSGAVTAYQGRQDCVEDMRREFARRRTLILDRLERMKDIECVHPDGAFYVFPSIQGLRRTSEEVAMQLLEDALIATVPGSAFGKYGEGYLRLAYSNSYENIEEAMNRMEKNLGRLSRA